MIPDPQKEPTNGTEDMEKQLNDFEVIEAPTHFLELRDFK